VDTTIPPWGTPLSLFAQAVDEAVEHLVAAAVPVGDLPGDAGTSASSAAAPAAPLAVPGGEVGGGSSSSAPFERGPPEPDEDLSHWLVSPLGYIRHKDARQDAGRITYFKNNISCTCYHHSRCSVAKSANKYSQEYMLAWFVKAKQLPASATSAEKKAEGTNHKAAFVPL
jgi:hypothetical protein